MRVLQARHLDQDAVEALALDVRLGGAERVDAAAQHFHRLLDGAADALVRAGLGDIELNQPIGIFGDLDRLVAGRPEGAESTDRLGELAQLRHQLGAVGCLGNAQLHAARGQADAALQADALLAQDAADVVAQLGDLAADQVRAVDLEQDVRAALQIEAERHRMDRQQEARNPGRSPLLDRLAGLGREQVRHGEPAAEDQHEQNENDLAGLETKHLYEQPCWRARI